MVNDFRQVWVGFYEGVENYDYTANNYEKECYFKMSIMKKIQSRKSVATIERIFAMIILR